MCLDEQSEMFVFTVCLSGGLPKYIKSKVLNTYFYLM